MPPIQNGNRLTYQPFRCTVAVLGKVPRQCIIIVRVERAESKPVSMRVTQTRVIRRAIMAG